MKNITIIKKEIYDHQELNTLNIRYTENEKIKEVEIMGEAVEIIEILCKALFKPFPDDYKTEEQLKKA